MMTTGCSFLRNSLYEGSQGVVCDVVVGGVVVVDDDDGLDDDGLGDDEGLDDDGLEGLDDNDDDDLDDGLDDGLDDDLDDDDDLGDGVGMGGVMIGDVGVQIGLDAEDVHGARRKREFVLRGVKGYIGIDGTIEKGSLKWW
ncbi:hypothetical protein BGZ46_000290 [Entomortierella lignicola]|nr:hypothetical protein BGZ46_000290 [Entomortierella lignicola]